METNIQSQKTTLSYIVSNAESILTSILWPDGPVCPVCGSHTHTILKDGRYRCSHCSKRYSIKVGTIFQHSHISLSTWLIVLYLMLENKGLSSCAMSRLVNVSQPSCYYMMMKLRFLFGQEDTTLSGDEIAIDEAYLGGTFSKMSLTKKQFLLDKFKLPKHPQTTREKIAIANRVNSLYKTPIIGISSGSSLILKVIPKPVDQSEILSIFKYHVTQGSHTISDCSPLYDNWPELAGCPISHNNHSQLQFKSEDGLSSNKIEGSFSQWKRQTLDKFGSISPRLLQLYLDEHSFRFNNRNITILERMSRALSKCKKIVTKAIISTYDSLFGKSNEIKIFDPWEFFNQVGCIIKEIKVDGVIYRSSEFRII